MALPVITARDICNSALRKAHVVGVGQTALDENINNAFTDLNGMIWQWSRNRWLVYRLLDLSVVCDGSQTYTIGPGGDIEMSVRPDRIESAYLRQLVPAQPNPVDWQVSIIQSREDYGDIQMKNLSSPAYSLYLDPAWPLGVIYPWPVPPSAYELHVLPKLVLESFTDLNAELIFPLEYWEALVYNLAKRIGVDYGKDVDPQVEEIATASLALISATNFAIRALKMPGIVMANGSLKWNIYSGSFY